MTGRTRSTLVGASPAFSGLGGRFTSVPWYSAQCHHGSPLCCPLQAGSGSGSRRVTPSACCSATSPYRLLTLKLCSRVASPAMGRPWWPHWAVTCQRPTASARAPCRASDNGPGDLRPPTPPVTPAPAAPTPFSMSAPW